MRRFLTGLLFATSLTTAVGCHEMTPEEKAAEEKERLALVERQRIADSTEIAGRNAYYVNVELCQKHSLFSDIGEHIKDELNAVEFALPTSRARYKTLEDGDNLVDAFRSGSLFMKGSIGRTEMTVEEIPEIPVTADSSSYRVRMKLKQGRISLDLGNHLKDEMNAVEFDWDIPGNVYNSMKEGDDFIQNGFRAGSFVMKGSAGSWHLKLMKKSGMTPQPK